MCSYLSNSYLRSTRESRCSHSPLLYSFPDTIHPWPRASEDFRSTTVLHRRCFTLLSSREAIYNKFLVGGMDCPGISIKQQETQRCRTSFLLDDRIPSSLILYLKTRTTRTARSITALSFFRYRHSSGQSQTPLGLGGIAFSLNADVVPGWFDKLQATGSLPTLCRYPYDAQVSTCPFQWALAPA